MSDWIAAFKEPIRKDLYDILLTVLEMQYGKPGHKFIDRTSGTHIFITLETPEGANHE